MGQTHLWQAFRQWKKYSDWREKHELREKWKLEMMTSLMQTGGGQQSGKQGTSTEYSALLTKYRSLKMKKQTLEGSYDVLFKFLSHFRVQIARCIEHEIEG